MPKYRFHVVGIRHHDYAGKLAELYQKAEGNSMSMHLEKDNVLEENAIIVYMADKFVGYVRTGLEREQAEELVRMNRLSVIGRVVEIDPEYRMITIEVDTDLWLNQRAERGAMLCVNGNIPVNCCAALRR